MRSERAARARGSIILTQSALVLLLALGILLAYPAIRSMLADSTDRDICALQRGERGADMLDPAPAAISVPVPAAGRTIICP